MKKESGFLRQSSWMVVSTFTGGILMLLVQTVAQKMGRDYSSFVALLRLLIVIGIPTVALQAIIARQAAAVTDETEHQRLIATVRSLVVGTFALWVICAIAVLVAIRPLSHLLNVSNPASFYFLLAICLVGLWIPVAKGLLQGLHDFFGLGWLAICDGVGRFSVMLLVVLILGGKVASAMFAVLIGQVLAISIGARLTRSIWRARPKVAFAWKTWLAEYLPLTLGLGTVTLMANIDMLFVQALFPNNFLNKAQKNLYSGAMLTGFAIIQFVAPVALVMFARVAKSTARAERGDSLGLTLKATILFGVLAGIGCTILPQLPLRVMYFRSPEMWKAAPLVPWFAWALLPWTVANVLVQNILAQGRFRAVLWMVLIPPIYATALCLQASTLLTLKPFDAFIRVIVTLGLSSTVLCLVAAWFSRHSKPVTVSGPVSSAPAISSTANPPSEQTKGVIL
jgi:O-antigen/teichoic acid export membrane protein